MGEETNNYSGEPSSSCVGLFLNRYHYHLIKFNCSRDDVAKELLAWR